MALKTRHLLAFAFSLLASATQVCVVYLPPRLYMPSERTARHLSPQSVHRSQAGYPIKLSSDTKNFEDIGFPKIDFAHACTAFTYQLPSLPRG